MFAIPGRKQIIRPFDYKLNYLEHYLQIEVFNGKDKQTIVF